MPIRFDVGTFLSSLGQIGAASIAGKMAGQQEREAEDLREYQTMQAALGQQAENQAQVDRTLLGLKLTPGSQAQVAGGIAARGNAFAPLAGTAYAQRNPALQQILQRGAPGQLAMGTLPGQGVSTVGAGMLPAGGRTFPSQYGPLELAGVDPKEATRVVDRIDRALADMRGYNIPDPRQSEYRSELYRLRTGLGQIDTPEALQAANVLLQNVLSFQSQVGGPQAQTFQETQLRGDQEFHARQFRSAMEGADDLGFAEALPGLLEEARSLDKRRGTRGFATTGLETHAQDIAEIEILLSLDQREDAAKLAAEVRRRWQAKLTPAQETAKFKQAMQFLGEYHPRQLTPKLIRETFARAGASHAIEGMSDAELRGFGSAGLEKEWEKNLALLTTPGRWKGLPAEARKAALDEIAGTAALTGRKIKLPADFILEASPEEQRRLAQRDRQLDISGRGVDVAEARLTLEEAKFKWTKQQGGPGGPGGVRGSKLTKNAAVAAARGVWERAVRDYDTAAAGLKVKAGDFNPLSPDMTDDNQKELSRLFKIRLKAGEQYRRVLFESGVKLDVNLGTGAPAPPPDKQGSTGKKPVSQMTDEELAQAFAAEAARSLKKK
jgi:hypothetical protein